MIFNSFQFIWLMPIILVLYHVMNTKFGTMGGVNYMHYLMSVTIFCLLYPIYYMRNGMFISLLC